MLFRNLRTFDFTGRGRPRTSRLIEQLEPLRFEACRPQQPESAGWVAPDGSEDGPLVLELGERQLMMLRVEQRVVPAAVVREEVMRRARELAAEKGRPAGRREVADLKERVLTELRPRAFTRSRRYPLLIDAEAGLVLTDAVTASAADRLVEAVRAAMGTLPLRLPEIGKPVPAQLTRWLRSDRLPATLESGTTCVLRDPRDRQRVVRVRGSAELAADAAGHIEAGFEVVELEMLWAERLRFRLGEDLTLRATRLETDEDASEADALDDPAAEFAAAALVETASLVQAMRRLREVLGVG